MNREIKPEDVERLIREGKLHFGDRIEFAVNEEKKEWTGPRPFMGLCMENDAPFISSGGWFWASRFPRPDLRDGDPVVVKNNGVFIHRIFKKYLGDYIVVYYDGKASWTTDEFETYPQGRVKIPSSEYLLEAGLDPNWYEGRRGLSRDGK